ncbi:hypothetical protein F4777DRAFT_595103 [Nemania sp. FL0916]|nr:hypothetical protein F4777DRAFT_595103 [Nemania sp. FL0916]
MEFEDGASLETPFYADISVPDIQVPSNAPKGPTAETTWQSVTVNHRMPMPAQQGPQYLEGPSGMDSCSVTTIGANGVEMMPPLGYQSDVWGIESGQVPAQEQVYHIQEQTNESGLHSPLSPEAFKPCNMAPMAWSSVWLPWTSPYPAVQHNETDCWQQTTPQVFSDQYCPKFTEASQEAVGDPEMLHRWPSSDLVYSSINPGVESAAGMFSYRPATTSTLQGRGCFENISTAATESTYLSNPTLPVEQSASNDAASQTWTEQTPPSGSRGHTISSSGPDTPTPENTQTASACGILATPAHRKAPAQPSRPPGFAKIVRDLAALGDNLHLNAQKDMIKVLGSCPLPVPV